MKTRFFAIILILLFLSVSCGRNKGMFVLQGTVPEGTDSILVVGLDSRFERIDTIVCSDGQFKWKFRPDTVTTLILVLPDGRRHPVFAEKGVESNITIPADTGLFRVSGGKCNEDYQSFYLASQNDVTVNQAAERIDSFITRDPFSEVTPYLIYEQMVQKYHADQQTVSKLILRMSGNMQDAPYLTSLKSEFKDEIPNNTYISVLSLADSADNVFQFSNIGGATNYLVVCVWASWTGSEGLKARRDMQRLLDNYAGRKLNVIDISIDVNKERWKETIAKDTLEWFSYIDTEGWESRIIRNSNIQQLPVYILFSSVKKVIYRTSSILDLDSELERTLPPLETPKDKEKPKKMRIRL